MGPSRRACVGLWPERDDLVVLVQGQIQGLLHVPPDLFRVARHKAGYLGLEVRRVLNTDYTVFAQGYGEIPIRREASVIELTVPMGVDHKYGSSWVDA